MSEKFRTLFKNTSHSALTDKASTRTSRFSQKVSKKIAKTTIEEFEYLEDSSKVGGFGAGQTWQWNFKNFKQEETEVGVELNLSCQLNNWLNLYRRLKISTCRLLQLESLSDIDCRLKK